MKVSTITSALLVSFSICSAHGISSIDRTLEACTRGGSSKCATPSRSIRQSTAKHKNVEDDDSIDSEALPKEDKKISAEDESFDDFDGKKGKSKKNSSSEEDTGEEEDESKASDETPSSKSKKKKHSGADSK